MTCETEPRILNFNEDFVEPEITVETPGGTTPTRIPATGLAFTPRFAARKVEPDGTPSPAIGGIASLTITEYSGQLGTYKATADKSQMQAAMPAYDGEIVYLILANAGNIDCVWVPYRVQGHRPAEVA